MPVRNLRVLVQRCAILVIVLSLLAGLGLAVDGELELRVTDADSGELVPVRMHLKNSRGRAVLPPRVPAWKDHFVFPGKIVLELPPGSYTFEMERGPEYKLRSGNFVIKQGDADTKQVTMERFVNMKEEGWWSGDLHIHRPPEDAELLGRAEDLHVLPLITWWNNKNLWDGRTPPEQLLVQFDEDRYYHVMAGEDERAGGALLYFNLSTPLSLAGCEREYPSPCKFLMLSQLEDNTHVDIEKPFWWDMPIWIASGFADSIGLCNNHMQRDGMLANEAWGKPRDTLAYPDPLGNGRWTQDIYYRLLNAGIRIPPSAGSASGVLPNPVGYNRVYVYCGDHLDYDQWWKNLRAGKVVVTNGPLIRDPRVNGELPGHVFSAESGSKLELHPSLNLSIRESVDYLEVIKNGEVIHEVRLDDWAKAGGELPPVPFERSGWMLIRAVTNQPRTYRFASTGPYYVEIGGEPRISRQAAQFFLDWVYDRARMIKLSDPEQQEEVFKFHRAARKFWQAAVDNANAD